MRLPPLATAVLVLAAPAGAQVFVNAPANVPAGPSNNGQTFHVDLADVDLDGDWDAASANGAAAATQQNRLWINQGGLQGGTLGVFADDTAARLPAIASQTRDVDFVDYDGDGDPDLFCVNTSQVSQQPCRFWTNQGGAQGGSVGFFADETFLRWVGLGQAGSSIWPNLVLGGGGYAAWAEAQSFADLDGDGDLDLVAAVAGPNGIGNEPTRLFLNDGTGRFSEFNPAGVQLTSTSIGNGTPGIWCEGVQFTNTPDSTGAQCDIADRVLDVDVADLDGDLDLDLVHMPQFGTTRRFTNRSETGALAFRDTTSATFPGGTGGGARYEQELGDLDGDADIDVYGVNWFNAFFTDATLANGGSGVFGAPVQVPSTQDDADAGELVDFDADGDLDVFLGRYQIADYLMRNVSVSGQIAFQPVPGGVVEGTATICWDVDAADVDGDGDDDLLKAHQGANQLLLRVGSVPDTHAPRIPLVEQPPDQDTNGQPLRIRAHVLDNASDLVTAANETRLWYQVGTGALLNVPMHWTGGQLFHGELPGSAQGLVKYFVTSQDSAGNTSASGPKGVHTDGGCSGQPATFCTGLLNSGGCLPGVTFQGAPSASAGSGFVLRTAGLVPSSVGLYFYSKSGPASIPFAGGLLCVAPPLLRTQASFFGGSGPCGGMLEFDFNAYVATGFDPALVAGATVWIQAWARDTAAATSISLSNGLTFTLCP